MYNGLEFFLLPVCPNNCLANRLSRSSGNLNLTIIITYSAWRVDNKKESRQSQRRQLLAREEAVENKIKRESLDTIPGNLGKVCRDLGRIVPAILVVGKEERRKCFVVLKCVEIDPDLVRSISYASFEMTHY